MARGPARIESAEVIRQLRNQLVKFDLACRNALMGTNGEVNQTGEWLRNEQRLYWKREHRRCEENVNRAKSEYTQAQWASSSGAVRSSGMEELRALKAAQRRLEEADQKMQLTQKWANLLDSNVRKMMTPCIALGNLLDSKIPKALARLDKMMDGLDEYFRPSPEGRP